MAALVEDVEPIDVLGPTIELLVPGEHDEPCVMRGTVPPGALAPLHSHPDPETFVALSGELEGFANGGWVRIGPGDVFHIPADAHHAFRNRSEQPAVAVVITTARLGRFFTEIGAPAGTPPSPERLERFAQVAQRYEHWLATPAENAAIGIELEEALR